MAEKYGMTALHLAAENGAPKTIKLLLGHGADATITNIHYIWDQSCLGFAIEGTRARQDDQDTGR